MLAVQIDRRSAGIIERVGLNERAAGSWRTSPHIEMAKWCQAT